MGDPLIRLGNYAHRQRAAFRRPLIVIAYVGIVARKMLWWATIPLWWIFYPPVMMLVGFCQAFGEMPMLTINQIKSDAEDLRRNTSGALVVWRTRKEPTV